MNKETINDFLQCNPTPESLSSLTVPELKLVCLHYCVEENIMSGFKKADFVDMVSQTLFDVQDDSERVDTAKLALTADETELGEEGDTQLVSSPIDADRLQSTGNPLPPDKFTQQMELMKMQLQSYSG